MADDEQYGKDTLEFAVRAVIFARATPDIDYALLSAIEMLAGNTVRLMGPQWWEQFKERTLEEAVNG